MNWEDVKKKYKGVELAKFLMEEYIELGNYDNVGMKYKIAPYNISTLIRYHRVKLQELYPEIYSEYKQSTRLARQGKTKETIAENGKDEWNAIKSKYIGVELSEFLMIEYISLGCYKELEEKYKVSKTCIKAAIKANLEDVKKDKPYIYELYKDKVKYNKENGAKFAKNRPKKYKTYGSECEELKPFTPKMFETLPAEMEYNKEFLKLMLGYNTGDRTGDDLVEIAAKYGTRVYNLIKSKKVFIV